MVGQTISHYRILRKLGSGGMGEVYLAEDIDLRRSVALKVLPADFAADEDRVRRFIREAMVASGLNHPNIAHIYEVREADGVRFIAMEYVEGQTLESVLEKGPPPIERALNIALQIADALETAHAKNIIHRDIKPANIMLTGADRVKVLDFGLAKVTRVGPDASTMQATSETGVILGTVHYMSPEQALGRELDHRSDIFSLGIVLYELCTGRLPFLGDTVTECIDRIIHATPDNMARLNSAVPPELERIVRKCLEKDPDLRYHSAREFRIDLTRLQEGDGTSTYSARLSRREIVLMAILIGAIAASAVLINVRPRQQPPASPPVYRQITFTGTAHSPALSRDGKYIAYATKDNGIPKVVLQDLSNNQTLDLATGISADDLSWSTDGAELLFSGQEAIDPSIIKAFRRLDPRGLSRLIRSSSVVVPKLGGNVRRYEGLLPVCWSPDGTRFAGFDRIDKTIHLIQKTTNDRTQIPLNIPLLSAVKNLDWSPDGKWFLVSITQSDQRSGIWTIRSDGSQPQKIMDDSESLAGARWNDTGSTIYYSRQKGVVTELWTARFSPGTGKMDGTPTPLLTGRAGEWEFSISRDGKHLAYVHNLDLSNLSLFDVRTPPRKITTGTLIDEYPSVSPDGTRVAFDRGDGTKSNIFVTSIDGGSPQQLTFFDSRNVAPVWSPDGRQLAFRSNEGGIPRIWRLGLDGTAPRAFQKTSVSSMVDFRDRGLTWSPGLNILYLVLGNRDLHILDPATEAESGLLGDQYEWLQAAEYSPDKKKILVYSGSPFVMSLEDHSRIAIPKGSGTGFWPIGWSPDGKWVYAFDQIQMSIVKIPATGGSAVTVTPLPFSTTRPPLLNKFPRDERFVASLMERVSDVWLVQNLN
jgi:serine/threonine protein kinase